MEFLPHDYESPKSNKNYMKFEDGENKIRVLTSPILGWEDWKDNKPVRFRMNNKPDAPTDPLKPLRHFWTFIVWDYKTQSIRICQIIQSSILRRLEGLCRDSDWGAPFHYDLKIVKSGQQKNTKYEINPSPKKEVDARIKEEFAKLPIDLDELFKGGDPFAAIDAYRTKAFWEVAPKQADPVVQEAVISSQELETIESLVSRHIDPADPMWRQQALAAYKIKSFKDLEKRRYAAMIASIEKKRASLLEEEIPF